MNRIPFRETEFRVIGEFPGSYASIPNMPIWDTPVSCRENFQMLLRGEKPLWMPMHSECILFAPRIIPDNIARGSVIEAEPLEAEHYGGKDMFGVTWQYVPTVAGSMVRPGNPLVKDICHWEDYVAFPDLDRFDWAGSAARNQAFLNDGRCVSVTIHTGLFERLVSFVDMSEALVCLVDEDSQEAVHRLFHALCVFYQDLFQRIKKWYNNDLFWFHDDWGSQRSPLFSLETCRQMLVPYLKRIVDAAHDVGVAFEFHSCGKNDLLVPAMVEAGVDLWRGQPHNDKATLSRLYGDKLILGIEPTRLPPDAPEEAVFADVKAFVAQYKDARVYCSMFGMPPKTREFVYALTRKAYCG